MYTWKWRSTHLHGIMWCTTCEIWRQSKYFREWPIAMDRNFIYCIWSEKTSISAMWVVGIFNFKPTTLSDRRKANPGFTKSAFKIKRYSHVTECHITEKQETSRIWLRRSAVVRTLWHHISKVYTFAKHVASLKVPQIVWYTMSDLGRTGTSQI